MLKLKKLIFYIKWSFKNKYHEDYKHSRARRKAFKRAWNKHLESKNKTYLKTWNEYMH